MSQVMNAICEHSPDRWGFWRRENKTLQEVLALKGYSLNMINGSPVITRPAEPAPPAPRPAPLRCYCFSCGRAIEGGVMPETAFITGQPMITGCPHCHKSFVD